MSGLPPTSPTEATDPPVHGDERGEPGVVLRNGDVAYASLWVPDGGRAVEFFARVVGWSFDPPPPAAAGTAAGHSRQVRGMLPHHGVDEAPGRPTLFLCSAVEGLDEASGRVRSAGGEADRALDTPNGRTADCRDDQGMAFALWELEPDTPRQPGTPRPGELTY